MTTLSFYPIHLYRVEPDRNMRRFYGLAGQPPLFGGFSFIRGCIGTGGQSLIETLLTLTDTAAASARRERTKRRRGYRDATRTALP